MASKIMQTKQSFRQMLAPRRPLETGRVWEVVELIEGRPGFCLELREDGEEAANPQFDSYGRLIH